MILSEIPCEPFLFETKTRLIGAVQLVLVLALFYVRLYVILLYFIIIIVVVVVFAIIVIGSLLLLLT